MQWLSTGAATLGAVLMSCSDRLSSASIDRFVDVQAGQHIQVHWYLLIGIAIVLGGGLLVQAYQPSSDSL